MVLHFARNMFAQYASLSWTISRYAILAVPMTIIKQRIDGKLMDLMPTRDPPMTNHLLVRTGPVMSTMRLGHEALPK